MEKCGIKHRELWKKELNKCTPQVCLHKMLQLQPADRQGAAVAVSVALVAWIHVSLMLALTLQPINASCLTSSVSPNTRSPAAVQYNTVITLHVTGTQSCTSYASTHHTTQIHGRVEFIRPYPGTHQWTQSTSSHPSCVFMINFNIILSSIPWVSWLAPAQDSLQTTKNKISNSVTIKKKTGNHFISPV